MHRTALAAAHQGLLTARSGLKEPLKILLYYYYLLTSQIGVPFGSYLGVLGPGLQSSGCHSLHCMMQIYNLHLSQIVEQRMHTCRLQTGQGNSAPRLLQRSHSLKSPVKGKLLGGVPVRGQSRRGTSFSNIVKMLFSNAQILV